MSDSNLEQSEYSSQRLSRITTLWTQFKLAHHGEEFADIRQSLLLRYRGAIQRYLLGAVRDQDQADELFHEFCLRFLQGDFHRANPERGRFRDYVRTVLINLVNDYHRARQAAPHQMAVDAADTPASPSTTDDNFDTCLRDELMDRTWKALESNNASYHAVLQLKVREPELTSREMCERLAESDIEMTASTVRKTVERARKKFGQLFLDQVLETIEFDAPAELRAELKRLRLLGYCESELDARGLV